MFAFIGTLFSFLWGGISAAIEAAVVVLQWAVTALWAFATATYNALITLGSHVLSGFQKAWDFLRSTYEDVLQPAWQKFWQLFDRVRSWLKDVFGPVFRFLYAVRDEILKFYRTWIKPVLDVIDAARQVLKVLEALHLKFAFAIDHWLGELEHWINAPFQLVLSKLNEVIGWVNRIATVNGLLQRVAFIRTLERDVAYVNRVLMNSKTRPLTGDEQGDVTALVRGPSVKATTETLVAYFEHGDADLQALFDSSLAVWQDVLGVDVATTDLTAQTS
jgi:hypothetical protein